VQSKRHDEVDARLETLLRAVRPRPDRDFARALEERLLPRRAARGAARRRRPLLAGAAAAAGLAAAALAFGLAGGGPLAPSGRDDVRAGDDCRYVAVQKRERRPLVVTGSNGRPTIRYRSELVKRRVKRCD
jgi:hypothetical protein